MKGIKNLVLSFVVLAMMILPNLSVVAEENTVVVKDLGFGYVTDSAVRFDFKSQAGERLPLLEYKDSIYVPIRSFCKYIHKGIEWSPDVISIFELPENIHEGKLFGEKQDDTVYEEVSMIELIAYPEKYDEKKVKVQGVINVGFESDYLYLTAEDYKYANMKNCIGWRVPHDGFEIVSTIEEFYDVVSEISETYVEISGTFKASPEGYPKGWLANVKSIYCCEKLQ